MTLSNVTHGRLAAQPVRILLQGMEGVGKSTFAAGAPKPIFLAAEDGTARLDVARFPLPTTWTEALEAINELVRSPHEFQTLVVDTLDWLESLCWKHTAQLGKKADIEDFGYGKGYVLALDQWRNLVAALERLRANKPMGIVLLAHTHQKLYANPDGDDYDRFTMKLHKSAAAMLREWCDEVWFACYDVVTTKDGQKAKAISTGKRLLRTAWSAAYDAKSRAGVADPLPLSWSAAAGALASKDVPELTAEDVAKEAEQWLAKLPKTWEKRERAESLLKGVERSSIAHMRGLLKSINEALLEAQEAKK